MQMRKYGVKFQKLDIILISHLHGDHYFGLMGLLSTMHLLGRVKSLVIYCPVGLKEIVEIQMKHGNGRFGYDIHFKEIEPKSRQVLFEDGKICIRCFPLKHKIPTHGFTITEKQKEAKLIKSKVEKDNVLVQHYHLLKKGLDVETEEGIVLRSSDYTESAPDSKVYAFCSDTAYFPDIVGDIEGADLLYHEATFIEKYLDRAKATLHSTASQAANIAAKAGVKKLLIGHFSHN
jgi:ribonuclease Z